MPVKKNGKAASKNNIHEHVIAGYGQSSVLDINNTTRKKSPQHNKKKKKENVQKTFFLFSPEQ